jgi:hypothetical protein
MYPINPAQRDRSVSMSFEEIEQLIGRPLPASARGRVSRQWWSNTKSHSQAQAWLSVGRKTQLNLKLGTVTFSKPRSAGPFFRTPWRA